MSLLKLQRTLFKLNTHFVNPTRLKSNWIPIVNVASTNVTTNRNTSGLIFLNDFATMSQLMFARNFSSSDEKTCEVPSTYDRHIFPQPPDIVSEEEHDIVIAKVNEAIANPLKGRLFAVVSVASQQYKITDHDIIRTSGVMPGIVVGDQIRLEKVLLVGGQEFTLIGRPILKRSIVKVQATVIEITDGAEKVVQYFKRRKSFERRYIYTPVYTVLRINSIQAYPELL